MLTSFKILDYPFPSPPPTFLQALGSELQAHQPLLSVAEQDLQKAKKCSNALASQFQEHCPDIERQEAELHKLNQRFGNLNKQIDHRSGCERKKEGVNEALAIEAGEGMSKPLFPQSCVTRLSCGGCFSCLRTPHPWRLSKRMVVNTYKWELQLRAALKEADKCRLFCYKTGEFIQICHIFSLD